MEMSSAPDIRRRPHRASLAPGDERGGKSEKNFQELHGKIFVLLKA
jgi:hypothetical protein